ncbi:MAG: leukotoxin LktA family filamentous adhesin, partial [Rhodoferax sp.]|nr:leukotoxin LktA family filamentous adhesin [Rhodoferax sp.]
MNSIPYWLSFGAYCALIAAPSSAEVVIDGRTATQVTSSGVVTDVRTSTLQSGVGLNSFSKFNVYSGETVNLHVPGSASALLNIVRDQSTTINGLLNSYQDGVLGGNVFFANPHGFVVGKTGVLNVGSLTVTTPTIEFLDRVVGAGGATNASAINQLISGNGVPLSTAGVINIQGRINALNALTLDSSAVTVEAGAQLNAGYRGRAEIQSLVNTAGLVPGGALVVEDGKVSIIASQKATIGGKIQTDGAGVAQGGNISITAPHISLSDGAELNAAGSGDARSGDISLIANNVAGFEEEAVAKAQSDVSIAIGNNVKITGGKIAIVAQSSLGSTLEAAQDAVAADAEADAEADTPGAVAEALGTAELRDAGLTPNQYGSSLADEVLAQLAKAEVALGVQVLSSKATVTVGDGAVISGTDAVGLSAKSFVTAAAEHEAKGLGVLVIKTQSDAQVSIGASRISSSGGNVDIQARNTNVVEGSLAVEVASEKVPVGISALVNISNGSASTKVAAGARIESAKSVNIGAEQIKSFELSNEGASGEGSVIVGVLVDVSSMKASTEVAGTVIGGEDVTIYAKMETQSNAIANTVLLGEVPKNALEKKIEELEEKKEKIEAASKNVSESLTQTISEHLEGQESEEQEQPAEEPPAEEQPPAEDKTPGKLRQFLDNFGVVGSVAVTNQDNAAQLTVKGTARIKAGGNLDVASEVTDILNSTVTAKITPLSEKQDPNDPSKSSLASNGKKNGLGVSVLVADQSSIATTKVESGAQLDATGELHIGSKAEQPLSLVRMVKGIKNLWEDTNSPFQNDQLTNKDSWDWLSTQFEEVQMTSTRAQTSVAVGTNAEPQVDSGANISGSVTVSNVGLKAQTVVADNVKINQDPAYQDAAQSVKIDSHVAAEMINVVGDPQTLLAKNGNDFKPPAKPLPPNSNEQGASAGGGAKRGLGASVGYNAYAVDSQVTVGNVEITAKDVTIESHNQVFDISGAVTGASSGNDALGGSVILNYFDNTSQATLGAGSTVHVANDLTVKATDDLFHVGLAGAVMKSSVNSFGFGVAYTNVQRDTQAAIVETGAGDIQAGNAIEVVAQNDGWVGGVAVAAAMAKKSTPQPGTGSATAGAEAPTEVGSATKDPSGNQSAKSGVTVSGAAVVNDISDKVVAQVRGTANVAVTDNAAKGLVVNAKNDTDMVALAPSMAVSMGAQQPSNSKNMAGSYAQNSVANQVKAGVSASEVRVKGGGVNIQADNAVDIVSVAAGAAGSSGQSGMNLAGSVTYNKINNTVESQLSNASVVHVEQGGLTVRTVDEGDITSIAGAAGVSGKGAAGMGFGVSVNRIASTTSAQVNGVKSIDVGSSDDVVVDSENHGDITSVAASLGFSRDGYAVTGAAAYNAVTATNKAEMVGSEVEQARNVSVTALSDPKIFTVAGQAGISLNDKAVGASAAYNTITTSTTAQMSDSVANAQQRVVVQGKQESSIKALAVGAQVAGGSLALQGSLAINTIDNDAAAKVIRSDVDAKGSVDVVASDTSGIQVLTGSAAIGFKGGTAVGIAGSYNEINGDVVASVEGGTVDSSNDSVRVDAVRTQSVESLAAGVAASGPGGKAALAGSVAVNRLLGSTRTEVKASAEGGAVIHAKNNALVRANTTNTVKTLAGGMGVGFSAVGAGLAVEINQLKGETSAIVSGAGTQVNAHGYGAKDGDVAGVGVTAESKDTLTSVAMGIGVAKSVGVGGAVAVNMLGGKTTAQVNQASLNQGTEGADADQSARVTARHASTADNYVLVVGASGTAGVGVGIAVTFQEHETVASTDAAALAAKDVVEVNAHGTGSVKGKVAGLGGGGTAGINGSVNVIKVADETRSTVKDSTLSGQGATRVVADADHQADAMVGSVAAGGGAGVGVSLAVTLANATTVAETAGSSQLNSTGKTEVKANARDNYDHTVATAGLGGSAGVAASVSVLVSEASTRATLGGTTQVNQNAQLAGEAQSVAVEAAQWFNTDVDTGSGAIGGGAGVGAALDVQVLRSGAVAQVGAGTNVKAAGDVSVDAKNERYVDSLAAALGGGGAVGIGAGISVINVSSVAEKKATEALENKLNDATSSARDNNGIGSQMGSGYAGSADLVNTASSKQQTIAPNATYASDIDPEKYSAGAHAMGTVQARNLQVRADNRSEVTSNAWGVAAGGTAAGGAGVSVVSVGDNSAAVLGGKATVSKDVLVRSNDYQDKAVKTLARAGAASFTGSLGAALSISSKSSTSKAAVADGASIVSQGRLTVRSQLDQKLEAETANLSLSLGAGVGISMGTTSTKGSAQALVGRAVNLKASHVNVSAEATSGTGVTALGASGGALLAANGAVAIASDATSARTFVDDGSTLEATGDTPQDAGGDINLTAVATPQVNTDAMGAALAGGLAVAASVSQATADVSAQATTGRANLKGKNLNVSAWANGSDKPNAKASSFAGSGAGLVGANATVANATTTTSVSAGVGDGAVVALTGDATVLARDTGSARVDASGVSVGGLAGIGVTSSDVVVRANTNASFGASGVVGKTLSVKTNGDNTVTGKLIAGSGGVLAGAATLLEGENHGSSKVRMGSSTNVTAGNIDVAAFRRANYKLEAESMQASVVGASGTTVDYDQNSTTEVNIGKGAKLTSMGSMQVQALTTVNGSATGQGGSGGVAAGGAVMVDTASTANTAVNIGDNAELTLVGNRLGRSLPMTIEARNDHSTADTAELWMAAAAGGPYAEANGDVTQNADVRIGDGAKIISNGRLGIGTLSKANSTSNANVTVYGLAAIGGGNTRNHVDSNEKVTVGTKARIHADDNLQLAAGRNASGTETGAVVSNAHTTVVNNTLIPITATMEGEARTNTRSILTLGKDSTVTSVLGVKLESIAAEATADGSSTGTNPFLSAFSAEDSRRDQKSTSMGTVSLDNATVVAGVSHTQELIFDEDGKATVRSALGDLSFQYTSGYKPLDELAAQIQKVSDQLAMAADPADRQLLQSQLDALNQARNDMATNLGSQTTVGQIEVGPIYAGGGDVEIKADLVFGAGAKVDAYGVPVVVVRNNTKNFLVMGDAKLVSTGAGEVRYTGKANQVLGAASLTNHTKGIASVYNADSAPSVPTLLIENTYDVKAPGHSGPAPAIHLKGNIENLQGSTVVTNMSGDMFQSGRVETLALDMKAPNGSVYINGGNDVYSVLDPSAEWYELVKQWLPQE